MAKGMWKGKRAKFWRASFCLGRGVQLGSAIYGDGGACIRLDGL